MIALNLLSPGQKESLRARVIYAMLERLMIAFVISLLISSVLLLFIKAELIKSLGEVEARQILSSEYVSVNDDIRLLTQQIVRVETLQKLAISPSDLLVNIVSRTPPGVSLTGMDFDINSRSMRINGLAAGRDNLLKYEESLQSMRFVTSLESPISNLYQKTDVNFQFMIVLDADAMRKVYEPSP